MCNTLRYITVRGHRADSWTGGVDTPLSMQGYGLGVRDMRCNTMAERREFGVGIALEHDQAGKLAQTKIHDACAIGPK